MQFTVPDVSSFSSKVLAAGLQATLTPGSEFVLMQNQAEKARASALLGLLPGCSPAPSSSLLEAVEAFQGEVMKGLQRLHEMLLTRPFLSREEWTLSMVDWVVFAALFERLSKLDEGQRREFCAVMRWFDYMQHRSELKGIVSKVELKRNLGLVGSKKGGKESEDSKKSAKKAQKLAEQNAKQRAEVYKMDLRVGKICEIRPHDTADKLYIEQIELDNSQKLQVVSGLREFVAIEDMMNRLVVVLVNIEPSELQGVASQGLVLCASNPEHTKVEPLLPPEGSLPGERISFEGIESSAPEDCVKSKKLHKLLKMLGTSTDESSPKVVCDGANAMITSKGVVTVASLQNARVK